MKRAARIITDIIDVIFDPRLFLCLALYGGLFIGFPILFRENWVLGYIFYFMLAGVLLLVGLVMGYLKLYDWSHNNK